MKNLMTRIACISTLALALGSGLRHVRAEAPIPHSIQLSGGYLDPATNTCDAIYGSVNGQSGVISRTTQAGHQWGFVSQVQYVSPVEAVITAPDYYTGDNLVLDARADTQQIAWAEYDEDGELVDGSPGFAPIQRLRIIVR